MLIHKEFVLMIINKIDNKNVLIDNKNVLIENKYMKITNLDI